MRDKKGVELPVNAMIIIILAITVLGAAFAIFSSTYRPGQQTTENVGTFNAACAEYSSLGCCQASSNAPSCRSLAQEELLPAAQNIDSSTTTRAGAIAQCCSST